MSEKPRTEGARQNAPPSAAGTWPGRESPTAAQEQEDMELTFRALASATRRQILDLVKVEPGITVGEIASQFDESRINTMKHLRVLEDAALVVSQKEGRTRKLYFNVVPIQQIYERWTTEYAGEWAAELTDLKRRAERRAQQPEQENAP